MFIQTEATPNPEVLKFLPGREVRAEGSRDFREAADAEVSPLAGERFEIPGVNRVFFGADFITVGKDADQDWAHLKAPILAAIMDHFTSGKPLFHEAGDAADSFSGQDHFPDEMERQTFYTPKGEGSEARIKERLDRWAALRKERGS